MRDKVRPSRLRLPEGLRLFLIAAGAYLALQPLRLFGRPLPNSLTPGDMLEPFLGAVLIGAIVWLVWFVGFRGRSRSLPEPSTPTSQRDSVSYMGEVEQAPVSTQSAHSDAHPSLTLPSMRGKRPITYLVGAGVLGSLVVLGWVLVSGNSHRALTDDSHSIRLVRIAVPASALGQGYEEYFSSGEMELEDGGRLFRLYIVSARRQGEAQGSVKQEIRRYRSAAVAREAVESRDFFVDRKFREDFSTGRDTQADFPGWFEIPSPASVNSRAFRSRHFAYNGEVVRLIGVKGPYVIQVEVEGGMKLHINPPNSYYESFPPRGEFAGQIFAKMLERVPA